MVTMTMTTMTTTMMMMTTSVHVSVCIKFIHFASFLQAINLPFSSALVSP